MENLVTCKFKGNETDYVFKTFIEVQVGDVVVVDTINGLKVATVTSLTGKPLPVGKRLMEIVDIVDIRAYKERKEKEEKLAKVKSELGKRAREINRMALYEALAEKDPVMCELLAQLKELE